MPNNQSQRRVQFSSCDACRHSRVACDASKRGHRPDKARWRGYCSRCSRRKLACTFEWINNVKKKPTDSVEVPKSSPLEIATSVTSPSESSDCITVHDEGETFTDVEQRTHSLLTESGTTEPAPDLDRLPSSPANSTDAFLTQLSQRIFQSGFETIFGLSIGRYGCPLVNDTTSDVCVSTTQLFNQLDVYIDEESDRKWPGDISEAPVRRQQRNGQIDKSLQCAIRAFSVQWRPLVSQKYDALSAENIVRDCWRAARKDMLKVINRPSYRSILALYLFAQIPTPVGISEDEELDGISGPVCMQTAVLHLQRLRDRKEKCPLNGPVPYLDSESRAYWAAVIWDTLSSFGSNFRTSLTSGLKGACSEPAWRLTSSFLIGSFQPMAEHWRTRGFGVSDDVVCQITAGAAICTLYVWKNITSLKEALREGVDEDGVHVAWEALLDTVNIFQTTIRPLLNNCERRLSFLEQRSRLSWYQVNVQYNLGILVLVDVLEAAHRSDLLLEVAAARLDAEHESFNVLKFGIESTYTIPGAGENSNGASQCGSTTEFAGRPVTVPLIAIDPYPHYVVDSVLLMNKDIHRKFRQGTITHEAHSYLSTILLQAVSQLPQYSKSVHAARDDLQQSLQDFARCLQSEARNEQS
ncbi:hypothetical protein BDV95DRAFT_75997 [Massariosphaeria phaeospora]|uniref:Zn(2)-C6 fungal-type domain-containing protein n=1 Tax=Massariosphaeria phaeospora TaxID=100035 RepID=A0A7C8MA61_9PLEO|nr:hypothetical protein BDV95DRAFT_75997 [Massariosphaeria phaeospora]